MRSWTTVAAVALCTWMTGCIVYKDGNDSSWSSGSSWTSTPSPRTGQLEVSWQVGAGGCESAEVDTVEVTLGNQAQVFPCTDEGATLTADVGNYPLALRGIDIGGTARYEGDGGQVRVRAGQTEAAPTVVLAALPVTLEASWYFENGRLCAQNDIQEIEADLFDADDALQITETTDCDSQGLSFEDIEAGSYVLLLLGRDGNGEVRYSGDHAVDALRGDHVRFEVTLVPEE